MRVVRSSTFHTNLTGKNLKVLNILCYDDDDDDDDDDEMMMMMIISNPTSQILQ